MARRHLTAKQHKVYEYLVSYVDDYATWPTYREISETFNFRSPNSVTQYLRALQSKGLLRVEQGAYNVVRLGISRIPIRGLIAAGQMGEAIDNDLGSITLEHVFPSLSRMFALRVSGNSMIDEGIQDGDYVLLVDESIPNGGIGAVLYDGETTLKRIYREGQGLRLEPANTACEDIFIEPGEFEEVRVLGRYVGRLGASGITRHLD